MKAKNSTEHRLRTLNTIRKIDNSAGQKKSYKCCFMKQKCQLQNGIAQYVNAATPLRTRAINTTHQHSQMRYITFFSSRGSKVISHQNLNV